MIPYGHQEISEDDVQAVVDVLRSDFLTQGPVVPAFENAVAEYCGCSHAVAVNSGTSALHIACLALGVGPGDKVWTSPITFVASANCALYCGAQIDFVDIDPRTYNISVAQLEKKLERAQVDGNLPKVVIPVHFSGQPSEMEAIHKLSRKYGFRIIEDASHAVGARYLDELVGGCRYSDITVLSFHPVKIITTAEGGMALTNDRVLATQMRLLRTHGITRDSGAMSTESDGPWYYEQQLLGFNYRLTDVQAALGLSQLQKLDEFLARRTAIAERYESLLKGLPLNTPWQHPDGKSSWHLYVIRLRLAETRKTRRQAFDALRASGVGVNVHYIPLYHQPVYKGFGHSAANYPEAEHYYSEAISLPIFPGLTESQQDFVVASLKGALGL